MVPVRGYAEGWNVKFEGIAVWLSRSAELVWHFSVCDPSRGLSRDHRTALGDRAAVRGVIMR